MMLLWKFCNTLWKVVFWIKIKGIGSLGCLSFYHIHVSGASLKEFSYEKVHNYVIEK
jgi:hypothetical protein